MKQKLMYISAAMLFGMILLPLSLAAELSDISGHKYESAIRSLVKMKVIDGYPDGTYKPNNAINRAEFLKIVIGASADNIGTGANCFPDVKNEWYAKYVCYAKSKNIVEGYPDGLFRPSQNVNYVEAMKMLYKANKDNGLANPKGGEWYSKYYEDAVQNQIFISGIALNQLMNRGEIARLTWNYREQKGLNEESVDTGTGGETTGGETTGGETTGGETTGGGTTGGGTTGGGGGGGTTGGGGGGGTTGGGTTGGGTTGGGTTGGGTTGGGGGGGTTTQTSGELIVYIEPVEARDAGARWRRAGQTTWMESGQSESGVPSGTHTLEFLEIAGWTSPARPQVSGGVLAIPVVTAYYHRVYGSVIHVDDSNNSGTVNGTAEYPYSSLQSAVDNALSGDTLKVAVGTYGNMDNQGKAISIIGGYPGADGATYSSGQGGDFVARALNPSATSLTGGTSQPGVIFTRFNDSSYHGVLDNLRVHGSSKGVVCDTAVSWPHPTNLTITNALIENNGQIGETTRGGGILVCGENFRIANSTIRNNHGGRGPAIHGSIATKLIIDGNRVENNTTYDDHGGGIYLNGPVTISNNLIAGNRVSMGYGWGGGVLLHSSDTIAYMKSNIIRDNHAPNYGGGVFVDEGATVYMDNDLIYGNTTTEGNGAGVAVDDGAPGPSHVYINNCTIAYNNAAGSGGSGGNGVFVDNNSTATVSNSIFWGNGDDFFVRGGSTLNVTYSLNQEGWAGTGNINVNPLFADASNGNFYPFSTAGRFDSQTGQWITDAQHSPAIDAGNPASSFSLETNPNGGRVNMGAYGNTVRASRSI